MKTHPEPFKTSLAFLVAFACLFLAAPGAKADPPCSLTGLNGNCTLTVSRLNPVAPSTVYVRHGSHVTVIVNDALPFENLTVDLKKASANPPVDQIQNGFSALTGVLSGLTILESPQATLQNIAAADKLTAAAKADAKANAAATRAHACTDGPWTFAAIQACQQALKTEFVGNEANPGGYQPTLVKWSARAICMAHELLLPLDSTLAGSSRQPNLCKRPEGSIWVPHNGGQLQAWVLDFDSGASEALVVLPDDMTNALTHLDVVIADSKHHDLTPGQYLTVTDAQTSLHSAFDSYGTLLSRLTGLKAAVESMVPAPPPPPQFTVNEQDMHERNNISETWDLNAANKLAQIAARIKADKYSDDLTQSINTIADGPSKQTVMEFTIQYMNMPAFEISSGVLVPIKPYHSYSVQTPLSAATSSGTCPADPTACGVVTYTPTTAFVPAAMIHISTPYRYVRPSRNIALLATGVVGYNSASSSASVGLGPSVSFGSFVLDLPIVWSQTQQLTGGFTVGGSAGTASAPTTKDVWAWSPAIGISLRIPLSGSSH